MIDPGEAWEAVCDALAPLGEEALPLGRASGRYLAAPLPADRDLPPADRSTMDGFAVRSADLGGAPAALRLAGELAAGAPAGPALSAGTCVRIFTGANLPPGADAVVPVEEAGEERREGEWTSVHFPRGAAPGAWVLARGANGRRGEALLPAGARLGPAQLALAAACGAGLLAVHRLPAAAVLTTGAELLPAEAPAPGDHEVRDSNGPLLAAALAGEGFPCAPVRRVPDDLGATARALGEAGAQVVLVTGGASVGRYDFLGRALAQRGATVRYHGIRMQPGKPGLFATLPGGAAVFGLPGNPLSALVALHEFALPALRLLAGCPREAARPCLLLPLGAGAQPRPDRWRLLPARLEVREGGTAVVPLPYGGSADLVTGALAHGAALVPPGEAALRPPAHVAFRPWGPLP